MSRFDVQNCFYYLISRATLLATAALRRGLSAAEMPDVKPAYLGVLMCLWENDGPRSADLGRCARLEPSTMTGLLDRMERDGLIRREPDPDDRRAQRIFLTERGGGLEEAVLGVVNGMLAEVAEGIPAEDLRTTKKTLQALLAKGVRRA